MVILGFEKIEASITHCLSSVVVGSANYLSEIDKKETTDTGLLWFNVVLYCLCFFLGTSCLRLGSEHMFLM